MVWSNYYLVKQTKKILEEEISSGRFAERLHEKLKEETTRQKNLVAKHYPEHIKHLQKEGAWHYFDAMFVSMDLLCSCGETLVIKRDMLDEESNQHQSTQGKS